MEKLQAEPWSSERWDRHLDIPLLFLVLEMFETFFARTLISISCLLVMQKVRW